MIMECGSIRIAEIEDKEIGINCHRNKEIISMVKRVVEKAIQDGLSVYVSEPPLQRKSGKKINDHESKGLVSLYENPDSVKHQESKGDEMAVEGNTQDVKQTGKVCHRRRETISVSKTIVAKVIQDSLSIVSGQGLQRTSNSRTDHKEFLHIERSESINHKRDYEHVMAVGKSSKGNYNMNVDGQATSSKGTSVAFGDSNNQDVTSVRSIPFYLASDSKPITMKNLLTDQESRCTKDILKSASQEAKLKLTNKLPKDIQYHCKTTNETEPKLPNEAKENELSTNKESFFLEGSAFMNKSVCMEKCKEQIVINDQNYTSLQRKFDSHEGELDDICEELFDLCLDNRSKDKETKEQIEFALNYIAGKDSLEATQVDCLNGIVEELQEFYLQLVQSHKRTAELDDYNIDINAEVSVLESNPVDVTRSSNLEYLVGKCRKLGSVIVRLGCKVIDDSIKSKDAYRQQHRAMKKKVRQINKSFSEALEERDERIQKLVETSVQMKECLDDAKSEKTSIEAFINSTTRENEKLQDEVEALRELQTSQREAHQEELDNMAAQEKFREREICNLRKDLQRKESQIDEIRREYDTALSREEAMIFSVEEAKAECHKKHEHLKQMDFYLTDLERDAENLTKQLVEKRNAEHKNRNGTNIQVKYEWPEMSKDNLKVHPRMEDKALEGDGIKPYDSERQTRCEYTSGLQNCVLPQIFHRLKKAIENAAATLGYFRNKVITLESENQNVKLETLRLQKAVREKRRLQDVEGSCRPNIASFYREDRTNMSSDRCTALYHVTGCCGLTPKETMFEQTRNVRGKPERDGISRDCNDNDLDREWSLIKQMKGENLKASRFLTDLQGEHGAWKISDEENKRDDNMVVETYQEGLHPTITNQRLETEEGNSALHIHHIRLLQTDVDEAREELLENNKEVYELKRSTTLLEMKLREKELTEQELRSNIKQLSTRCQDLEQDTSFLKRSKFGGIAERRFAGQLL